MKPTKSYSLRMDPKTTNNRLNVLGEQSRSSETPRGWRFLNHTADLRIEIHGHTPADLFVNAAKALSYVLIGDAGLLHQRKRHITLHAHDLEDLMVDWLRQLLFEYQAHGKIPAGVEILEIQEGFLDTLVAFGVPTIPTEPDFEIKGVTYHGLSIHQKGNSYSARVIFDV